MMWNLVMVAPLLAAGFFQQTPPQRGRFLAKLVDAQGKALADVPVLLWARAHAKVTVLPVLDRLELKSDSRGAIRAGLIRGLEYGAYALREDGPRQYSWTAVMGGVQAGDRRVLKLTSTQNGRVRVRVEGREAWKSEEPLRYSVEVSTWDDAPNVARDFDPEGEQYLPMMPGSTVLIQVRGKSGLLLDSRWLQVSRASLQKRAMRQRGLDAQRRAKEDLLFVGDDLLRFRIAAPAEVSITVTDEGQSLPGGKTGYTPIAGARVWIRDGAWRTLVATCDELGFGIVKMPGSEDGYRSLLIEADGYAERDRSVNVREIRAGRDRAAARKKGLADVKVQLMPGKSSRTRILLQEGKPAAGMAVLVSGPLSYGRNSWNIVGTPRLHWTDDNGTLLLPGSAPRQSFRVDLVLDAAAWQTLTQEGKLPPHPLVTLYQGIRLPDELPKEFELERFSRVEIQVKSQPSFDRMSPEIVMARIRGTSIDPQSLRSAMADPRGRLSLLVPGPGEWALGACTTAGIEFTRLALEQGMATKTVELRLREPLFIEGTVRTSSEQPIPGVRVSCSTEGDRRPELSLIDGFRRYGQAIEPVCDKSGRFRIPIPAVLSRYTLSFAVRTKSGSTTKSSWDHRVDVGEESAKGVEITIDPPRRK